MFNRSQICPKNFNRKQIRRSFVVGGLVLLLVLILWLLYHFPLSSLVDHQAIAEWIDDWGFLGTISFVSVGILATAVGLPRQLMAFVGGYSFGVVIGLAVSLLAAIGGCFLCFQLSRRILRRRVMKRFGGTVQFLNRLMRDDAFFKIIVLRLQPLGTNLATNLAAGVTTLSTPVFIGSSFLGYIPQMLVFSLMGSGVRVQSSTQLTVSVVLFIVSLLLGVWLYRRHLNQMA